MKFQIFYDDSADNNEVDTIRSFLRWQQRKVYLIYDRFKPQEYSCGRTHIYIQVVDSDEHIIFESRSFNDLYEWYDSKGLIQC